MEDELKITSSERDRELRRKIRAGKKKHRRKRRSKGK
jgi:hypothetical protein